MLDGETYHHSYSRSQETGVIRLLNLFRVQRRNVCA
jgi:hypothetical protein